MKKDFTRRDFLRKVGVNGMSLAGVHILAANSAPGAEAAERPISGGDNATLSTRQFLERAVLKPQWVDYFLGPEKPNWAFFDPELGFRLKNSVMKNGLDGALTFSNYAPTGERRMINWADKPCRINTYGNSFTQCHQCSDGETWQEYLAAHLGEPIRNYGIGGYGVYQAYLRMLREEATPASSEYLILNIFDDDHIRSLMKWRWLYNEGYYMKQFRKDFGRSKALVNMFHANPWAYVRIDPKTAKLTEYENPYPTPQSLYKLCDKEHVYEAFKDDFVVQIVMARKNGKFDYPEEIEQLRRTLNIPGDINNPTECRRIASTLLLECSFRASMHIVEKAYEFASSRKKRLMLMLSYSKANIIKACRNQRRFDRSFVEYLREKNIPFIDSWQKHTDDFQQWRLSPEQYVEHYYVGDHYNPCGNHFFAFTIKDEIVNWLEPKPPAYRQA